MIQTAAIFLDAYRQLQARKLFWFVLVLSALCVLVCAAPGIDAQGFYLGRWKISDFPTTAWFTPAALYKFLFVELGIKYWLTFFGTMLALISTAGLFPDFLTGGAVDLVLCKPIGRLRLFLTKYAAGLLFVTLQTLVFVGASFLVIGLRGKVWEPGLFLAVPLVILFFSYLFAVCVLVGVLTRSTLAALLLTLVFWIVLGGLNGGEAVARFLRAQATYRVEQLQTNVQQTRQKVDTLDAQTEAAARESMRGQLTQQERELDNEQGWLRVATGLHRTIIAMSYVLPKTGDTAALLERTLLTRADLPAGRQDDPDAEPTGFFSGPRRNERRGPPPAVRKKVREFQHVRGAGWIITTSLAFEAVVVAGAAWRFCRRDF